MVVFKRVDQGLQLLFRRSLDAREGLSRRLSPPASGDCLLGVDSAMVQLREVRTLKSPASATPDAAPAPASKQQALKPEKPDEAKYKEDLAKAEKEYAAAQEKFVRISLPHHAPARWSPPALYQWGAAPTQRHCHCRRPHPGRASAQWLQWLTPASEYPPGQIRPRPP